MNVTSFNFILLNLEEYVTKSKPQHMTSQTKRNKQPINEIKIKCPYHTLIYSYKGKMLILTKVCPIKNCNDEQNTAFERHSLSLLIV